MKTHYPFEQIKSIQDFYEKIGEKTHAVKPPAVYQGMTLGTYEMKCKLCGLILTIDLTPYGLDMPRRDMEEHIGLHKTQELITKIK